LSQMLALGLTRSHSKEMEDHLQKQEE
jgi:hypothetical protein